MNCLLTGILSSCTNLLANNSYCVQPVGDGKYLPRPMSKGFGQITNSKWLVNSYPNALRYTGPSSSISKVAYASLPDAPYASIFNVAPLASQTCQGCDAYASRADLQYDYYGVSQCDNASKFYDVTVESLILWNPSLQSASTSSNSSTNLEDGSFFKQFSYCMDNPTISATASVSGSRASTPLPTATKH